MKYYFTAVMLLCTLAGMAQTKFNAFGSQKITDKHCLYVDAAKKTNARKFTFKTVREALLCAEKLTAVPTDTSWVTIYVAPSVYWIDNPDEPAVARPQMGDNIPYGMKVKMNKVRLIGLSSDPKDVVLASQRGQTQGADGNFTMLHITGDDFQATNVTFGNYCNVDLDYPRDPRLNRKRRADAIVQAQLVICNGDRYRADNCRFISRLNLCPFAGARHATFDDCYFECTDDALCGTGVYNHCRFTFFSSKPFYATSRQGAFFNDCDIHCKTHGTQYLTKMTSPVTLRNCRFTSDDPNLKVVWTKKPNPKDKCYMIDCTLNGKPLIVPTTPDVPMPVSFALFGLEEQREVKSGRWTLDAHCPSDLGEYTFEPDTKRPAWVYGEGMDGAEECYGLIQNVRGARMMYTSIDGEKYDGQSVTLSLDPCKGPGQGFGSATGQYLDVCLKFDTRTLTGYGIRFVRTPKYDRSVETYLVEYCNGNIRAITEPQRCDLFKRGCKLSLHVAPTGKGNEGAATLFSASITNGERTQKLSSEVAMNVFGGIHIQHTGSTGASATVISQLKSTYE